MPNKTQHAPPRYKISDFFSSLLKHSRIQACLNPRSRTLNSRRFRPIVVLILSVGIALLYLIENHAEQILVLEFRSCFLRSSHGRDTSPQDKQDSVGQASKDARIMN